MARRKAAKNVTEEATATAPRSAAGEDDAGPEEGGLRGLGPRSLALLAEEGLTTRERLEQLGPAEAFRRVRARHPEISYALLWQLSGALLDLDWRELPGDMKQHLLFEVEACVQRAARVRST